MNKILVLDDDPDIASVVSLILEMHGYICQFITDYRELNTKVEEFKPEILIIDISLGGADGRDLCKALKENPTTSQIHVILFSANRDASKDYTSCRAEAFIPKPFDSKHLLDTIQKIVPNTAAI